MPVPYKQYTEELYESLGMLAAWPLNQQLAPGDIGELEGNVFHYRDQLSTWRIPFDVEWSAGEVSYEYATRGAVDVAVQGGLANTPGVPAAVNVGVTFRRASALYFAARRCRIQRIRDIDALESALLDLHRSGTWRAASVVITEVVASEDATVLISGSERTSAQLLLEPPADLKLEAQLRTRIQGSTGALTLKVVGQQLTPLFRAKRVKRRAPLFGDFGFYGGEDEALALADCTPE